MAYGKNRSEIGKVQDSRLRGTGCISKENYRKMLKKPRKSSRELKL